MKKDYYVEMFQEIYPKESVRAYFVLSRKGRSFVNHFFSSFTQVVLFRTEKGHFIWLKLSLTGEFISPLENTTPRFEQVGKNKVQVSGAKEYDGTYQFGRHFHRENQDKKKGLENLIGGAYDD